MRPWVSVVAAALLYACGGQAAAWQPVSDRAQGGGVELSLVAGSLDNRPAPWKRPLPNTHCMVYKLTARSVDNAVHEVRPDDFRAGDGTPLDAVGRCFSAQLEPTWVGTATRTLWVTVLAHGNAPPTLMWRPHEAS
jgi:hypothetical protein